MLQSAFELRIASWFEWSGSDSGDYLTGKKRVTTVLQRLPSASFGMVCILCDALHWKLHDLRPRLLREKDGCTLSWMKHHSAVLTGECSDSQPRTGFAFLGVLVSWGVATPHVGGLFVCVGVQPYLGDVALLAA